MAIPTLQQSLVRIIVLISLSALVACGGGGGGGKKKDTTPNTFAFTAVQNASVSSQVVSQTVTITGMNAATAITITGGEYAIGTGAFTAAAGTVENNQTVRVRVTTPSNTSASASATLTIGGVSAVFTVTTITTDVTPEPFTFTPEIDASVNTQVESDPITVTGINNPVAISITGGDYAINDGAFTATAGTIENNQTVKVRLTTSANTNTPVEAVLTIGGVSATFTVTTIADTTPDAFSFAPGSISDVAPNSSHTSSPITVTGIDIPVAISITNGEYKIGAGEFTATAGTVSSDQTVTVRVTAPNATDATETATLTIGGVVATYSVTTYPDEVAPTANIVFPPPATATIAETITIRGTAADDFNSIIGLTVEVTGAATTSVAATSDDGFATWQAVIPLTDGANTLTLVTEDSQENTDENAAQVVVYKQAFTAAFPNNDVGIANITAMALDKTNNRVFVMKQSPWAMIAVDLATGERSVYSSSVIPDNQNVIEQTTALAFDFQRNRILAGSVGTLDGNAIYSISLGDENTTEGTRSVLSNATVPNNTQPLMQAIQGVAVDPVNSDIAYVLGKNTQNLARMNILTGERTLVSDNTMPESGASFVSPLDVEVGAGGEYAWVVNEYPDGMLKVNLNTGARSSVEQNGYPNTGFGMALNNITINAAKTHLWGADVIGGLVRYDIANNLWSLVWPFPRNINFENEFRAFIDINEQDNYIIFAERNTKGVYLFDMVNSQYIILSKSSL